VTSTRLDELERRTAEYLAAVRALRKATDSGADATQLRRLEAAMHQAWGALSAQVQVLATDT